MRYFGLAVREHYLLEVVKFRAHMGVLEIGVGAGKAVKLLKNKVKEFWGVDASKELVDILNSEYFSSAGRLAVKKGNKELDKDKTRLICLDVCDEEALLGKRFDVIFSLDTLEHVECPQRFFSFTAKHLKEEGRGVVVFPNESAEKHHGFTWFEKKKELENVIKQAGLRIELIHELRMTFWHRWIKKLFWDGLKKILLCIGGRDDDKDEAVCFSSQVFDETFSFRIKQGGRFKLYLLSIYASMISWMIRLGPLFKRRELQGEEIRDKRLLLILQ